MDFSSIIGFVKDKIPLCSSFYSELPTLMKDLKDVKDMKEMGKHSLVQKQVQCLQEHYPQQTANARQAAHYCISLMKKHPWVVFWMSIVMSKNQSPHLKISEASFSKLESAFETLKNKGIVIYSKVYNKEGTRYDPSEYSKDVESHLLRDKKLVMEHLPASIRFLLSTPTFKKTLETQLESSATILDTIFGGREKDKMSKPITSKKKKSTPK